MKENEKIACACGYEIVKSYGIFGKKEILKNTVVWMFTCQKCGREYYEEVGIPIGL